MTQDACELERILIVEDDAFIREELAELLKEEGFLVLTACNGKEALSQLELADRPCVILLDLMMPIMNGWDFRAAQRADPKLAAIPIVVMTGVADGAREARALDAAHWLSKPFEFEPLLAAVHTHCGNKAA